MTCVITRSPLHAFLWNYYFCGRCLFRFIHRYTDPYSFPLVSKRPQTQSFLPLPNCSGSQNSTDEMLINVREWDRRSIACVHSTVEKAQLTIVDYNYNIFIDKRIKELVDSKVIRSRDCNDQDLVSTHWVSIN